MKENNSPNWVFFLVTFFVALVGTYFVQVYTNDILGIDNKEVERVSYDSNNTSINFGENKNSSENMIEDVMKSVVGISRLQANEESIFDVQVSQKWGLRNWNYCLIKWVCVDKSTFGWKCWNKTNC